MISLIRKNAWVSLWVVGAMLVSQTAYTASRRCEACLRDAASALREVRGGLSRHEFYAEAKAASRTDVAALKRVAKTFGVDDVDSPYFIDYIDAVYREIKSDGGDAADAAEKMAQFGKKIDPIINKVESKTGKKAARFGVADAVLSLEEFKPSQFKKVSSTGWTDSGAPFVDAKDYMKYVKGYIDNKPPYSNHPWSGSIITQTDIRDGASHNMFPLQLQPHDMRHIHFAIGHPRPVAMYFKSARSQNPQRFAMMGAMYEGVDSVQYPDERLLAMYMGQTKGLDLEDAMVYIAKATRADMKKLMDAAQVTSDMDRRVEEMKDWVPKKVGRFDGKGWKGTLDDDVDFMVDEFEGYIDQPGLNKYTFYQHDPVAGQAPDHQSDMVLFMERVQQLQQNGGN